MTDAELQLDIKKHVGDPRAYQVQTMVSHQMMSRVSYPVWSRVQDGMLIRIDAQKASLKASLMHD